MKKKKNVESRNLNRRERGVLYARERERERKGEETASAAEDTKENKHQTRTVFPVPGAPARSRARPAIFLDLMSSTTMDAASRARS